jgi:hypothetical protein
VLDGNRVQMRSFITAPIVMFAWLAGCAAPNQADGAAQSGNRNYVSLEQAISDAYQMKGNDSETSNCLGTSMIVAVPQDDRAKVLSFINGRNTTAEARSLYDKWIVIGHERDRPEINDTMYGTCPLQWAEFLKQGTLR